MSAEAPAEPGVLAGCKVTVPLEGYSRLQTQSMGNFSF
jgi:hypothetical protein